MLRLQLEEHLSNNEICRMFKLTNTQLNKWKSLKPPTDTTSRNMRKVRVHVSSRFMEFEQSAISFISERRSLQRHVSVFRVISHLANLHPRSKEIPYNSRRNWLYRLMKRNKLSIRRITKNTYINDEEKEMRIFSFLPKLNIFTVKTKTWFSLIWTKLQLNSMKNHCWQLIFAEEKLSQSGFWIPVLSEQQLS